MRIQIKERCILCCNSAPCFLNGEILPERCTAFTDTAGLSMQYDSEEEAEEGIKDWLERMCVGYQDGDLVKIANLA